MTYRIGVVIGVTISLAASAVGLGIIGGLVIAAARWTILAFGGGW